MGGDIGVGRFEIRGVARGYFPRKGSRYQDYIQLHRSDMTVNHDGSAVFQISPMDVVRRFLILGTTSGTYYVRSAARHTEETLNLISGVIKDNGPEVVDLVREVSYQGLAPKNNEAILVLSMCASSQDLQTRRRAFDALQTVCRTGSHLLQFISLLRGQRGLGRLARTAITRWYQEQPDLPYQVSKYQSRYGISHRDVMRLIHPYFEPDSMAQHVARAVVMGINKNTQWITISPWHPEYKQLQRLAVIKELHRRAAANGFTDTQYFLDACREYKLTREEIPQSYLRFPFGWHAILPHMPMGAMLRNIRNLGKCGLLSNPEIRDLVISRLEDTERLAAARVHPYSVMQAFVGYRDSRYYPRDWKAEPEILDALGTAFIGAFRGVEPSFKKFLLGIDVSGSMHFAGDNPTTPAMIAACMGLVVKLKEPNSYVVGYDDEIHDVPLNASTTLSTLLQDWPSAGCATDCCLPMKYARENRLDIDTFVVITDNETNTRDGRWTENSPNPYPYRELLKYRQAMDKPDAQLVVIACTATDFTIADPNDPNTLDVVGFDSSVPKVLSEFARGSLRG